MSSPNDISSPDDRPSPLPSQPTVYLREHNVLALNSGVDDVPFKPLPGQPFSFNKTTYNQFLQETKDQFQSPPIQLLREEQAELNGVKMQGGDVNINVTQVNPFSRASKSHLFTSNPNTIIFPLNNRVFPKYFKPIPHHSKDVTETNNNQSTTQTEPTLNLTMAQYYHQSNYEDYTKLVHDAVDLVKQFQPDYDPNKSNYTPKAEVSLVQLQHIFSPPQRLVFETIQREYANGSLDNKIIQQYPGLINNLNSTDINRYMVQPEFDNKKRKLRLLTKKKDKNVKEQPKNEKNEHKEQPQKEKNEHKVDLTGKLTRYLREQCMDHLLSSTGVYLETPFVDPELLALNGGWNVHTANQYNSFNSITTPPSSQQHSVLENSTPENNTHSNSNNNTSFINDIIYPNINKDVHNIISTAFFTPQDDQNNTNTPISTALYNEITPDHSLDQFNVHQYWFNQPNSITTLHVMTELNHSKVPVSLNQINNINNSSIGLSNTNNTSHQHPSLHTNESNTISLPLVPCRSFFPPIDHPDVKMNPETGLPNILPNSLSLTPTSILHMTGKLYSNLIPHPLIQPYYTEQLQGYAAYGQASTVPFLPIPMDLSTPNEKNANFLQRLLSSLKFVLKLQDGALRHAIATHIKQNHSVDSIKCYQAQQSIRKWENDNRDGKNAALTSRLGNTLLNSNGLNSPTVQSTSLSYQLYPIDYDYFIHSNSDNSTIDGGNIAMNGQHVQLPLLFNQDDDPNEVKKWHSLYGIDDYDSSLQQFNYQINKVEKEINNIKDDIKYENKKNRVLNIIKKHNTLFPWWKNYQQRQENQNEENLNNINNPTTPLDFSHPITLPQYKISKFTTPLPYWYPYSSFIYTYCDTIPIIPIHDEEAIDKLYAIAASRVFDFDTLTLQIQHQVHSTPMQLDMIKDIEGRNYGKLIQAKKNNNDKTNHQHIYNGKLQQQQNEQQQTQDQ